MNKNSDEAENAKNGRPDQDGWSDEQRQHHITERSYWKRAFYVAIGAAAAGLGSAAISGGQLTVSRKQLLYADRPWVKIVSLDNVSISINQYAEANGNIKLKNIGNSPAINIVTKSKFLVEKEPAEFKEVPALCKNIKWADDFTGNALFPEDTAVEMLRSGFPPINTMFKNGKIDMKNILEREDREQYNYRTSKAIRQKFVRNFTIIVCVQYEIYNDPVKHYTAKIYQLYKKTNLSEFKAGSDAVSFDMEIYRDYKNNDLNISTEDFSTKAD